MTNLASNLEQHSPFLTLKDTFIFDGNSQSAHIIARTILTNDSAHTFDLIPKQNTPFFGFELPEYYKEEKFILITQSGEVLSGNQALNVISKRLKLKVNYH
jgi:hypothetical protein